MTPVTYGVIDLGTNTFHLLLVEKTNIGWQEVYRERIFVNLAEGGIQTISAEAWERGMQALKRFTEIIEVHCPRHLKAVGTAALRRASNAGQFTREVNKMYGIDVEVIDGATEARYICRGVLAAVKDPDETLLIMDIGGGSVEFCITSDRQLQYAGSFPIGVAVLYDLFHKTEPITKDELRALDDHLDSVLAPMIDAMNRFETIRLVGASGSFEVLDRVIAHRLETEPYATYDCSEFEKIYRFVTLLDLEQRLAHPDIPAKRAQYIVCALHLIHYMIRLLDGDLIGVSSYAMKEGIVEELINLD